MEEEAGGEAGATGAQPGDIGIGAAIFVSSFYHEDIGAGKHHFGISH